MDTVSLIVGLTNAGAALLLIALVLPLLYGKIPRNNWYGFRFPSSLASDEAWYAVNRYGARQMLIWSAGMFIMGIVSVFVPMENNPTAAVVAGSSSVVVLIPAIQSWLYSRRFRVS